MTHSFDPIQTCKATATKTVLTTQSLSAGFDSETDDDDDDDDDDGGGGGGSDV